MNKFDRAVDAARRTRRWAAATLGCGVALCASVAASGATAEEVAPEPVVITGESVDEIAKGNDHTDAACNLGVSSEGSISGFPLSPQMTYFTRLRPATSCSCPGPVQLNSAIFEMVFQEICPVQVRVSVIHLGSVCPVPIALGTVCGPIAYSLDPTGLGVHRFVLPLPHCCIDGEAFLAIQIVGLGANCS